MECMNACMHARTSGDRQTLLLCSAVLCPPSVRARTTNNESRPPPRPPARPKFPRSRKRPQNKSSSANQRPTEAAYACILDIYPRYDQPPAAICCLQLNSTQPNSSTIVVFHILDHASPVTRKNAQHHHHRRASVMKHGPGQRKPPSEKRARAFGSRPPPRPPANQPKST